jgi:hypothetical protein
MANLRWGRRFRLPSGTALPTPMPGPLLAGSQSVHPGATRTRNHRTAPTEPRPSGRGHLSNVTAKWDSAPIPHAGPIVEQIANRSIQAQPGLETTAPPPPNPDRQGGDTRATWALPSRTALASQPTLTSDPMWGRSPTCGPVANRSIQAQPGLETNAPSPPNPDRQGGDTRATWAQPSRTALASQPIPHAGPIVEQIANRSIQAQPGLETTAPPPPNPDRQGGDTRATSLPTRTQLTHPQGPNLHG